MPKNNVFPCFAIVGAVRRWHYCLHERQFTVITDRAALHWLSNLKNITGRLSEWFLKFFMFEVTIKHEKNSDILKRMFSQDDGWYNFVFTNAF